MIPGLATSAAPTIYRPLEPGGYRLIDGGTWANNPVMLAIIEAMISYNVPRKHIKVLSIGCGDEPYHVTRRMTWGGLWQWRKLIGAAMRAQSLAATSQARLLTVLALVFHAFVYGPQGALIAECFTPRLRYSGTSIGYQPASITAGGPAPLIATALLAKFGSGWPIAVYILFYGVVSVVATGPAARFHQSRHIGGATRSLANADDQNASS